MKVLIQKKVLGLQISMDYHVTMTVVHARNYLLEKTPRFVLLQLKIEKITVR